eukprot:scaffold174452_cov22-Tisochrysis_lutea.AAC.2
MPCAHRGLHALPPSRHALTQACVPYLHHAMRSCRLACPTSITPCAHDVIEACVLYLHQRALHERSAAAHLHGADPHCRWHARHCAVEHGYDSQHGPLLSLAWQCAASHAPAPHSCALFCPPPMPVWLPVASHAHYPHWQV